MLNKPVVKVYGEKKRETVKELVAFAFNYAVIRIMSLLVEMLLLSYERKLDR